MRESNSFATIAAPEGASAEKWSEWIRENNTKVMATPFGDYDLIMRGDIVMACRSVGTITEFLHELYANR